ncbi:MAG TPA: hypothetical protein DCZ12_02800 [Gammaproteobacteria bacterium]|nr:hypothetical protein [Gammaproteobacteria bacterium]
MYIQPILEDIYQYGEKLFLRNQFTLASSVFLGFSLVLNVTLILSQPSLEGLIVIFALGWLLLYMVNQWAGLRKQLTMFDTRSHDQTRCFNIRIASRAEQSPFYPIPPKYVQNSQRAASEPVCQIIRRYAEDFPCVRKKMLQCEKAHRQLTNHDAANLLMMVFSLREAAQK